MGNYHQHNDYAFVWDLVDGLRFLNRGDYLFATAFDISSCGKVVGYARKFDDINGTKAILWDAGTNTIDIIETLDGPSYARNINSSGDVVGNSGSPSRAFIWNDTQGMRDLGALPAEDGDYFAMAINNHGRVAGYVRTDLHEYRAFIWECEIGMTLLSGDGESLAYGINNHKHVVGAEGYMIGLPGRAYLWKGDERIDLNDTIPPDSGWELREARAINDQGQICGSGLIDGNLHAFLMTPVPLRDGDTDDDGIPDDVEDANHNEVVDPWETDPFDMDTDRDGLQDGTEIGYTLAHIGDDTDTNVFQPDLDPTSTTDPRDPDTDDDRFADGVEDANHNGMVDAGEDDPREPCLKDPVRVRGATPVYFEDIQSCYDAAVDGDIIEIHGRAFPADLEFNQDISLILKPGYRCAYPSHPSGTTTIRGSVNIKDGSITVPQGCLKITP